MNLMLLLEMAAAGMGERVAVQCAGERWTHAELFAGAGRLAARIRDSGALRVAVLDVSSPAVPLALFASAWAGKPFVPINYRLSGAEVDALIERVTPVLLVTDRERAKSLAGSKDVKLVVREDLLAEARAAVDAPAADWSMEPEEIAIWLFTSGTTGVPKAALLRHRHLVSYILGSVEYMSAAEDDAALVSVPPYHVAGMAALLSSIYSGRRMVQLPAFSPEAWLELAESERITNAFMVPTMLARVVERLEATGGTAPSTLRALAYGGGKMPQPVIERAMRLFPSTDFTNAYGLTETSSTLSVLGPADHREAAASADPNLRRRLSSVGKPLPGVELEIRDAEGKPAGPGERGEICVRGEQVSGEYLGRASRVGADGWFPTHDGGFLDEGGYLFVEGRIDDVIVRGGENLSPGEIEDVLLEHPAVSDVAVVGVPDVEWGEGVAAAVVLKEGVSVSAEELQAWVKQHLRSSRVPQLVRFEPELPYNETGKLLRRKVRETLTAGGDVVV
jgi:acyl-CoA synthetase (AMP-forming)/AMP-acid ligase II